jgi:hypothetical protein
LKDSVPEMAPEIKSDPMSSIFGSGSQANENYLVVAASA